MGRCIAAIIRHGDYRQMPAVPSAHQPHPLNQRGRQQALEGGVMVGQILRNEGWQLAPEIDSSQLLRGWQSADIIANHLATSLAGTRLVANRLVATRPAPDHETGAAPLRVVSFDALAERCVGAAANLTAEQIRAVIDNDPRYPELPEQWKSDSHYRLPLQGAESLMEAGERVARHLEARLSTLNRTSQGEDQLKLFVGHGAAFRHAAYHLGLMEYEQIAQFSMHHGQPILFERLDADSWRLIGGAWKVRSASDHHED